MLLADPLIHAWLREKAAAMAGAVPIIQILAIAVAIRVGNATGTTLLKGAGQHRMLAWVNLGTGVVNLVLSVALIKPFGLPGVAYGTLIPIALSSAFILYPAACRRVGLSVGYAFAHSVLPAVCAPLAVAVRLAVVLPAGRFWSAPAFTVGAELGLSTVIVTPLEMVTLPAASRATAVRI